MAAEVDYLNKHIVAIISNTPNYSTHLPGGVWKGVAPNDITGRHLVFAYAGGQDVLAFSGGYVGAGMEVLLKVIDASPSDYNANVAFNWVESSLLGSNGSSVSGAYVWLDKLLPFDLPDIQDDITYQQIGRTFKAFVDPLGL